MPNAIAAAARQFMTNHKDLVIVLVGGAIGGLLATAVQALIKHDGNLETFAIPGLTFAKGLLFCIFGAIAAAVSVYVAANSRLDDLKRLAFFALLCGITFPAILVRSIDQDAEELTQSLELSKDIAKDQTKPVEVRAAAAEAVATEALDAAPASEVDSATRADVRADTSAIIKSLQSEHTPEASQAASNILEAAKDAGYIAQ